LPGALSSRQPDPSFLVRSAADDLDFGLPEALSSRQQEPSLLAHSSAASEDTFGRGKMEAAEEDTFGLGKPEAGEKVSFVDKDPFGSSDLFAGQRDSAGAQKPEPGSGKPFQDPLLEFLSGGATSEAAAAVERPLRFAEFEKMSPNFEEANLVESIGFMAVSDSSAETGPFNKLESWIFFFLKSDGFL
jgi:hypothetical protein